MKFNKIKRYFLIINIIFIASTSRCLASSFSIAALVNDQIISVLDLESRMRLVFGTSNIPYNDDTVKHFRPQILNQMIDDVLKIEEAERIGIDITEESIESAIDTVEQNNRMPKGGLREMVKSFGISEETLKAQMKAEVAWLRIARRSLMPNITITDEEVNEIIAKKKANIGKPEMLVSEIFLPVNDVSDDEDVFADARKVIGYVASGVDFGAIAKQLSQSPTAVNGGDLGWISEGQLEKELDEVVTEMTPPSLSSPIKTKYGYYVLYLRDKRLASMPDEKKAVYNLSQIFIPSETLNIVKESIVDKVKETKSCVEFNNLAKEVGFGNSGSLGMVPVANMPPAIYETVKNLDVEIPSKMLPVNEGNLIFMVCDKKIPGGIPSADEVRKLLELEKLDKMAQRKLRELRRAAIIEIR